MLALAPGCSLQVHERVPLGLCITGVSLRPAKVKLLGNESCRRSCKACTEPVTFCSKAGPYFKLAPNYSLN